MHPILERQLKRGGLSGSVPPGDSAAWAAFLGAVGNAYAHADQDRDLLERSLALSSEEMGELHAQLAAERDMVTRVICSLDEGVCAVDRSGRILFANPCAARLLRLPADADARRAPLHELVRARTGDGRCLGDLLRSADAGVRAAGDENRLVIDGDERGFISFSLTPLGAEGAGAVLTLFDATERKRLEAERAELNRQLLEASRAAGMAEVATGVLHNVGNVLNSVNVSASVASEVAAALRTRQVGQVGALLRQNKPRLAEFLGADPAGSRIDEFLIQLGEHLEAERARVLSELDQLRSSVDHIREIVAAQQSYATKGGVREYEPLAPLVEEALRVSAASLARHSVRVVRDYRPAPAVLIERHQVLHILVNLISNAKQALSARAPEEREIAVSIAPDGDAVIIRVCDNGCGIAPENLTRVFAHGFTTRRDGHGFGLHSAALAVSAMGGSIAAASDGPGRGAAFTVRIPIAREDAKCAA
ncbi:MAG TPA: ATP-binding protein [Phycisphaerales bacterium]|nr:ATP-binding protein [Phycisphaerales bacterium]